MVSIHSIFNILLAAMCGVSVYIVLQLAAWMNLRDEPNVCRNQSRTRRNVLILAIMVDEYRDAQGKLPSSLEDLSGVDRSSELPYDHWGRPLRYEVEGEEYWVSSLGRDGLPGGVGLDADLYSDGRNTAISRPTLKQFFGATDPAEVDRGGFTFAGVTAAAIVFFISVSAFRDLDLSNKAKRPSWARLIGYGLGIVLIATLIGVWLLPLHIPSGH